MTPIAISAFKQSGPRPKRAQRSSRGRATRPYDIYDARKKEWESQNPGSTYEEHQAAMRRISSECGVWQWREFER